ncbi:MAG: GerW family sporulation protein [Clostridia bacterium]|nr:GerW family sporulation protein [Clostridia bacterium]
MSDRPIEGLMGTTLDKIKQMVDVNTIVGNPITTPDGTTVIPVSKVMYGFASGGSEFNSKKPDDDNLFGGGAGAGVTIAPIAFIVINGGDVRLLQISPENNTADKVVGMVPDLVDKVSDIIASNSKKNKRAYRRFEEKIENKKDVTE